MKKYDDWDIIRTLLTGISLGIALMCLAFI